MTVYSELIDRVLLQPSLLEVLQPREPLSHEWVRRLQATNDAGLGSDSPLVRGALFFALDALDPAHRFFQDDSSDLGSYWHGMLHRREGDFDNARYWFRRAGILPFFAKLHGTVAHLSGLMARQANWDPYLFTGECEQAKYGAEDGEKLPELQRAEFENAFEYTWRQAAAK